MKNLQKIFWRPLFRLAKVNIRIRHVPFVLIHFSFILLFFVDFYWGLLWMAIGLYYVRMLAITAVYHRYFSHRSYKVRNRLVQFLLALWGATAAQKGAIWWAASHRHHHRYSDTERDLHSPQQRGFWYAHILWIMENDQPSGSPGSKTIYPKDLGRYPELVYLDRLRELPAILLGVGVFLLFSWAGVVWYLFSTLLLYHGTYTINSFSHIYGRRRFDTKDTSRNNFLLAMITLGEGWHNNHHYSPSTAKSGLYWYEIDITYYFLWLMKQCRLIHQVSMPSAKIKEQGRQNDSLRKRARVLVGRQATKRLTQQQVAFLLEKATNVLSMNKLILAEIHEKAIEALNKGSEPTEKTPIDPRHPQIAEAL